MCAWSSESDQVITALQSCCGLVVRTLRASAERFQRCGCYEYCANATVAVVTRDYKDHGPKTKYREKRLNPKRT